MTWPVEELASDVQRQLQDHIKNCTYFSMAMDESNDISDTHQVAVFVGANNDNIDVILAVLGLESSPSTAKGSYLFETLKNLGICTDGALAMMGSKSGCLTLLEQFLGRPIFKYHCILHHYALCGRKLNLKNIMDVFVQCVNKIHSSALNRREFRQFQSELNE
ncbi:hypothetical protein RF11_05681 [Thelohanellus kitauei]|uniref:DUF4371 domain-containing protein n=1 Tax=Thelohanellus kitauei TaxID=669202 RepID=A0A0C2JV83_THEKT|nr:hypothetical protein RF11_05681 [Thelohanellus kitauei]